MRILTKILGAIASRFLATDPSAFVIPAWINEANLIEKARRS